MVDVLVIGGGNAALCAALTAREAGAPGDPHLIAVPGLDAPARG
ncbi:TcuA [Klebsiella michiganensis]|nr:TcuA [Klebsiella michiganensis]